MVFEREFGARTKNPDPIKDQGYHWIVWIYLYLQKTDEMLQIILIYPFYCYYRLHRGLYHI